MGQSLTTKKIENVVLQQLYVERCTADLIYVYIRKEHVLCMGDQSVKKNYCQCFIQNFLGFYNFSLLLLKLYNLSTMYATCSETLGILQAYLRYSPEFFC